jgi:hypothetical protein
MRLLCLLAAAGVLLQACSIGPILPGGCDQLAMSESRQQACESGLAPHWAKSAATAAPEPDCRRTLGGMECYAPAR